MPTNDDATSSAAPDAPSPSASSLMSRHLQKFGSPDLEVVVGKEERVYRYHAIILASQSLYVDTLLSSPAATKEQAEWRVSFPGIEVSTWEKMMKYLAPNIVNPYIDGVVGDLLEIIPFYDQFQFQDGLKFCDLVISKIIPEDSDYWRRYNYRITLFLELSQLVSMIYPLNFFPLSKPVAEKWAARCLSQFRSVDEEMIRLLMPLVENNEEVIKVMVSTYLGRKCKGMTMNNMRDLIKELDFPKKCILRCKQIREIDEQLKHLHVGNLRIENETDYSFVHGKYCIREIPDKHLGDSDYYSDLSEHHNGGVMKYYWIKVKGFDREADDKIIIEPMDVFGSVWEIYHDLSPPENPEESSDEGQTEEEASTLSDQQQETLHEQRRVLLRWENGIFGSLTPPKNGWEVIDDNGDMASGKDLKMTYSIEKSRW